MNNSYKMEFCFTLAVTNRHEHRSRTSSLNRKRMTGEKEN